MRSGEKGGAMNRLERIFQVCLCFFAIIALFPYGYSQIPRLHDIVDRTLGGIPELIQVLDSPTLTTGIDDAVYGFPLLDDYDPQTIQALGDVSRSQSGGFFSSLESTQRNYTATASSLALTVPGAETGIFMVPCQAPTPISLRVSSGIQFATLVSRMVRSRCFSGQQ